MDEERKRKLIGAIDQGTSSSRFLVFSIETGELVTYHQVEVEKIYPNEGWVEQDPVKILDSVLMCIEVVAKKLSDVGFGVEDILCVGLTNQRESTILWDSVTGKALYNSIVWLDNRTSDLVENLADRLPGRDINYFKNRTGLPISTYFSALKIKWLMNNVPEVTEALNNNRLMFGTVDSWLLWNLTGNHLTDVTNASRTLLLNLETLDWDAYLCSFFKIPKSILPNIKSSADNFGLIRSGILKSIPITGVIGDQNAALVGQRCLRVGQIKVTYGTGAFLLQNIGPGPLSSALKTVPKEAKRNLLATVAYKLENQPAWYALEGSIATAGAAITWLRDNLQLIKNYDEVEKIAQQDSSAGGLFFVPAFQGLYAPYWDAYTTGTIIGISQFSRKCHLVRATLEGVAFQTHDILSLMNNPANLGVRIDGGMSSNNILCQILANITGNQILRSKMSESTSFGAAMVASYPFGLWDSFGKKISMIGNDNIHLVDKVDSERQNANLGRNNSVKKEKQLNKSTKTASNGFIPKFLYRSLSYLGNVDGITQNENTITNELTNEERLQYDLFKPDLEEHIRQDRINTWHAAVHRSLKWIHVEHEETKKRDYLRLSALPLTLFVLGSFALTIISSRS